MHEIQRLLDLMAELRDPETGCPWDRAQTYESIVSYTLEEAYEIADAITRENRSDLKNELGDLLFQIVFYSQMAQEEKAFTFVDVVTAIIDKMIRRHPHVFGNVRYADLSEQSTAWERFKAAERDADAAHSSELDGIPVTLPALARAVKLQRKAAGVGFDWSEVGPVIAKVREELDEIQAVFDDQTHQEILVEEIGDLLFACINLARHIGVDPEQALRKANSKFEHRFRYIETGLAETGRTPRQSSLSEMDQLWEQAKAEERRENH